jgi:hypothetical protein
MNSQTARLETGHNSCLAISRKSPGSHERPGQAIGSRAKGYYAGSRPELEDRVGKSGRRRAVGAVIFVWEAWRKGPRAVYALGVRQRYTF